jgi:hypothetical protein
MTSSPATVNILTTMQVPGPLPPTSGRPRQVVEAVLAGITVVAYHH